MARASTDVYMSPLLASQETLRNFPHTVIVVSDLDPCLDENVQGHNLDID